MYFSSYLVNNFYYLVNMKALLIIILSLGMLTEVCSICWNFNYKNSNNILRFISSLHKYFVSRNYKKLTITFICVLFFIIFNSIILNVFFNYFDLNCDNLMIYLWLRICIKPYIMFVNYLLVYLFSKLILKNKTLTFNSIFENIVKSLNLVNTIVIIIVSSIFYEVRLHNGAPSKIGETNSNKADNLDHNMSNLKTSLTKELKADELINTRKINIVWLLNQTT